MSVDQNRGVDRAKHAGHMTAKHGSVAGNAAFFASGAVRVHIDGRVFKSVGIHGLILGLYVTKQTVSRFARHAKRKDQTRPDNRQVTAILSLST